MMGASTGFFEGLPPWLGTAPTWGIFLLVAITLIKTWPIIQKNLLDSRDRRESRYSERITTLEQAVRECQQECDDHKKALREELFELEEKRLGDRRQHIQEQISLVAAIVESVDNPVLKRVLDQLQTVKRAYELTGVIGDKDKDR